MPVIMDKPLSLLSHCSLFSESFAHTQSGRYTVNAAKSRNTYIADIEKTVANAAVIKYAGKNGVKLDCDLAWLSSCSDYAVDSAQKWVEASGKDHVVFVLEGDNVEQTSPFILAQLEHIRRLKKGNRYKVTVLIVKGVQEDGYSKAFVECWLRELSELNVLAETYFAVVGTTKAEEHLKADISYSLAGLVLNIGSAYKHEGFMFKLNREGKYEIGLDGKKVKSVGYRELCEMRDSPLMQEVTRLENGPLPAGLTIFKRVGAGELAAMPVGSHAPPTLLTSPSSVPLSPSLKPTPPTSPSLKISL